MSTGLGRPVEGSRPTRQDRNIQHEFSLAPGWERIREKKGGQEASKKRKPPWAVKVKALERALRH